MAISSPVKKDQLRLVSYTYINGRILIIFQVHVSSQSVFSNWPTSSTPLGKVTATAFSHGSEYLAIGNTRGRVLLYGLRHYWNA